MAKLVSMKCPECNAPIDVDPEREFCFCQYCGTKILLVDENTKKEVKLDVADVKRAETEQLAKKHQIEEAAKDREQNKIVAKISGVVLAISVIGLGLAWTVDSMHGLMIPSFLGFVISLGIFMKSMGFDNNDSKKNN